MKALAEETERAGIESEKAEESRGEKTESLGVRTPVVVEKDATKKKVRVVKKIVKKKIIKKVPKRVLVGSSCNDLENVSSPNPNENSLMETEKVNSVADDLEEVVNVKEFDVTDMDKGFHLVESNCSCRDGTELKDDDQNQIELKGSDKNRIELQDGDQNRIELEDSVQNRIELEDSDQNRSEVQDSDQMPIECQVKEYDINTMNADEHEGVKELVVNSETDDFKTEEVLSEKKVSGGEMMACGLQMKRSTKIFIHGLVDEIKEEDIRNVFEEVGEVVEVKLIINLRTGKSRGFGFIRYASADLANLALIKYQNVEICGRSCHTAAIEGNDTILLNNIDKKWKKENVVEFLRKIDIKNINEVLVVPDPHNIELNLGFAFLEFETKRDAEMAYNKLQNNNFFGKKSNIKVSWAEPFVDPVEEETHKIKSVYAEHIPSSWDEKEVKDRFEIFGEIESIALAKNLRSTKRKDFAFINYKTCEGALSCIEALTCKSSTSNNIPKGYLKVSLTKSVPKVKPTKTFLDNEISKFNQKSNQSRPYESQYQKASQSRQSQQHLPPVSVCKPPQKPKNVIGRHEDSRKDLGSSTTAELVQLLREQASWKQGMSIGHHHLPSGGNQLITELGSKSLYHDHQAYHQTHLQIPNATHHRSIANITSFPPYDQQPPHYKSGSFNVVKPDLRYFQIRDQTTYPGSSSTYRPMH